MGVLALADGDRAAAERVQGGMVLVVGGRMRWWYKVEVRSANKGRNMAIMWVVAAWSWEVALQSEEWRGSGEGVVDLRSLRGGSGDGAREEDPGCRAQGRSRKEGEED